MNIAGFVSFWTLLFCALRFDIGLADTEADGYSGKVKALFGDLKKPFYNEISTARAKMDTFPDETNDRQYAIGLINLYTQPGMFYTRLNNEMRRNYPKKTDVWRRAGELMNRGIDILGPQIHTEVFRGCQKSDKVPEEGKEYQFNQITSATHLKQTAVAYITCPNHFIFRIEKISGLSVKKYSDLSLQKEVLIKSTYTFRVKEITDEGKYRLYHLEERKNQEMNGISKTSTNIVLYTVITVILIMRYVCGSL